jgi:hypothetical protein
MNTYELILGTMIVLILATILVVVAGDDNMSCKSILQYTFQALVALGAIFIFGSCKTGSLSGTASGGGFLKNLFGNKEKVKVNPAPEGEGEGEPPHKQMARAAAAAAMEEGKAREAEAKAQAEVDAAEAREAQAQARREEQEAREDNTAPREEGEDELVEQETELAEQEAELAELKARRDRNVGTTYGSDKEGEESDGEVPSARPVDRQRVTTKEYNLRMERRRKNQDKFSKNILDDTEPALVPTAPITPMGEVFRRSRPTGGGSLYGQGGSTEMMDWD